MAQKGSKRAKIALLRLQIARLLVGGASERTIARQLGKAPSTIHHHAVAILRSWQKEMAGHRNRWIGEQLAKIARIEDMAYDEFMLSREGKSSQSIKGKGLALMGGGRRRRGTLATPIVEVERVDRQSTTTGSPEFLSRLAWCIAERNRLLGLYHPDSEPFMVQHEPDTRKYERARRVLVEAFNKS